MSYDGSELAKKRGTRSLACLIIYTYLPSKDGNEITHVSVFIERIEVSMVVVLQFIRSLY